MTPRPARIVDAHVHLWDPARTDWYPYLSGRQELNMGDVSGMARRFDMATYMAEASGWNVEKLVNVAAATGVLSVEETLHLDEVAADEGHLAAIIGGLPATDTVDEAIAMVDRQMGASRFRGVRPMGRLDGPLPSREILAALRDRGLVFELMSHPDTLRAAAEGLAGVDGLVVVVEHTGWPRSASDEETTLWRDGMTALADLGDRVHCKLSGLAMPLASMAADAFAPWIETAIQLFGTDRAMFASNFPVDGMHGSLDELFTSFAAITAGLDDEQRDRLFAGNAERLYRC